MKAVLMAIHPKWCEKIFSGKKTIEVRKIAPKLETPSRHMRIKRRTEAAKI